MRHILKCPNRLSYGLKEDCACGEKRVDPKPAKFSPEDKYAKYRRAAKLEIEKSSNQDGQDNI